MKEIITAIEQEVYDQFKDEGTGHDWYHINRVRQMALYIQQKEGGNADIIELAALLHDISDYKFNGGDFDKGAVVTDEILKKYSIQEEVREAISAIVKNISFKGSGEENTITSLEGKIVQDADRIDALGALGIARTFAYGGSIGQPIYDPTIPPKQNQSATSYVNERTHTINHFYEKLLLIAERMNTPTGEVIAQERTQVMRNYLVAPY